jgi:hypothetical protein
MAKMTRKNDNKYAKRTHCASRFSLGRHCAAVAGRGGADHDRVRLRRRLLGRHPAHLRHAGVGLRRTGNKVFKKIKDWYLENCSSVISRHYAHASVSTFRKNGENILKFMTLAPGLQKASEGKAADVGVPESTGKSGSQKD